VIFANVEHFDLNINYEPDRRGVDRNSNRAQPWIIGQSINGGKHAAVGAGLIAFFSDGLEMLSESAKC
jgi:hypothetical protein